MARPLRLDYPGPHITSSSEVSLGPSSLSTPRTTSTRSTCWSGPCSASISAATRGASSPTTLTCSSPRNSATCRRRCIGWERAPHRRSTEDTSEPDTSIRDGSDRGLSPTTTTFSRSRAICHSTRTGEIVQHAWRLAVVELRRNGWSTGSSPFSRCHSVPRHLGIEGCVRHMGRRRRHCLFTQRGRDSAATCADATRGAPTG